MEKTIKSNRLIGGLLAFLGENSEFSDDIGKLQNALYEISMIDKFKNLFVEIKFFPNQRYYYSEEVELAIKNLEMSRLLSIKNPDLLKYVVTKDLHEIYDNKADAFFGDKLNVVKDASIELKRLLCQK